MSGFDTVAVRFRGSCPVRRLVPPACIPGKQVNHRTRFPGTGKKAKRPAFWPASYYRGLSSLGGCINT